MNKLQIKIKSYLRKHKIRELILNIGVGSGTIYWILDGTTKPRSQTIKKFYSFFKLPVDSYLEEIIEKEQTKDSILGEILLKKRIALWLTKNDVVKQIKWSMRQLEKLENWKLKYKSKNSFYITKLLDLYQFSKWEKEMFFIIQKKVIELNGNTSNLN